MKQVALIGYSGHAYVVVDIFQSMGRKVSAYCDVNSKKHNPCFLHYLGSESLPTVVEALREYDYFIAVGDNNLRSRIYSYLSALLGRGINAVHRTAYIGWGVEMDDGVMVGANAVINPFAKIGRSVICNTGAIVEHECSIGDFCHIAPGAVLAGNVTIGSNSFIGANAVIRQGIKIGKNVVVGAGSVVVKDIPDGVTVAGNPQRTL